MHVSKFRTVPWTLVCFVALLTPCVGADGQVTSLLAANNREDVLLEVDVPLSKESRDNGTGTIYDIALSPDGTTFAYSTWGPDDDTGAETGYLVLCETNLGRILWKIKAHFSGAYCLAFSPDGKLLATGSSDEHVKLWNAGNGKLLFDLTGHTHAVFDVEFSPDGKTLATCSADGTVRLWDCATGKGLTSYAPAQILKGNQDVYCVAFTPDGKQLISTYFNNKTLCVWNIAETHLDAKYTLPDNPGKFVVSRDGKRVACHGGFVWNLETGKLDPVFGQRL